MEARGAPIGELAGWISGFSYRKGVMEGELNAVNRMAKMSEEVIKAIDQYKPALVATADINGMPNVSIKGSLRVLDDEHVVFAILKSPKTLKNVKENPLVSAIAFDTSSRKGWRLWGKADIITYRGYTINCVIALNVMEALTF
ncbi:MAG: pyridoxamine 5'-phosphate oxidase family protein [Eubacteriales bacterium]